jgi:hypothetical protein
MFLLKISNNNVQVTVIYIAIEYLKKNFYFILVGFKKNIVQYAYIRFYPKLHSATVAK